MGMTIDFTGKTVLVTGAGRGLGRDMALQFADCGADVYMGNRKEDQGLSVVREIEGMGRRAVSPSVTSPTRRTSQSSSPTRSTLATGRWTSLSTPQAS